MVLIVLGKNSLTIFAVLSSYSRTRPGAGATREFAKFARSSLGLIANNSRRPFRPRTSCDQSQFQVSYEADDRDQYVTFVHPEGLPYFYHEKFVTTDNMNDPKVKHLVSAALNVVLQLLRCRKETSTDFTFHEDVEFCIELKNLNNPPEFNYYIVDHKKRSIFWADDREPPGLEGATRGV